MGTRSPHSRLVDHNRGARMPCRGRIGRGADVKGGGHNATGDMGS
jgi:hypothetical protein